MRKWIKFAVSLAAVTGAVLFAAVSDPPASYHGGTAQLTAAQYVSCPTGYFAIVDDAGLGYAILGHGSGSLVTTTDSWNCFHVINAHGSYLEFQNNYGDCIEPFTVYDRQIGVRGCKKGDRYQLWRIGYQGTAGGYTFYNLKLRRYMCAEQLAIGSLVGSYLGNFNDSPKCVWSIAAEPDRYRCGPGSVLAGHLSPEVLACRRSRNSQV
jgi:hypothetical protein